MEEKCTQSCFPILNYFFKLNYIRDLQTEYVTNVKLLLRKSSGENLQYVIYPSNRLRYNDINKILNRKHLFLLRLCRNSVT